jgi:APA family basic amino acid/polyamine antiporter
MALSLIQVGGLLFVIAVGAPHIGEVNLISDASFGGVAAAAALVFFAFIGFDEVATLAEETRNPARTVPLALITGLAVSTLLYLAVAITAISVLGGEALGASETPLADVVASATGQRLDRVISAVALLSTVNTTLLMLTAGSRVLYGMGEARALPAWFGHVSGRRNAPRRAILIIAVMAAVFVAAGDLRLAASFTDFAVYVVFLSVNATVVVLRFRLPDRHRPFRVPLAVRGVPIIPILGFLTTVLLMTRLEPRAILLGTAIAGTGMVVGYLIARRTGWTQLPRTTGVPGGVATNGATRS